MKEVVRGAERRAYQTCSDQDLDEFIRLLKRNNVYHMRDHARILKHCGRDSDPEIRNQIRQGIASALVTNLYRDYINQNPNARLPTPTDREDWFSWLDVAPPPDYAAGNEAEEIITATERFPELATPFKEGYSIESLFIMSGIEDPEEFGQMLEIFRRRELQRQAPDIVPNWAYLEGILNINDIKIGIPLWHYNPTDEALSELFSFYQVQVTNIGMVYEGFDEAEAQRVYDIYVEQVQSGYGRAADEMVYLMENGEVVDSWE